MAERTPDGPTGPCACGQPGALAWGPDVYCWEHLPTSRAAWPIPPRFHDGIDTRTGKRITSPVDVRSTTAAR